MMAGIAWYNFSINIILNIVKIRQLDQLQNNDFPFHEYQSKNNTVKVYFRKIIVGYPHGVNPLDFNL